MVPRAGGDRKSSIFPNIRDIQQERCSIKCRRFGTMELWVGFLIQGMLFYEHTT